MSATVVPTKRRKVSEFPGWAQQQPEGRGYELVDGEVIAMAPERVLHNLAKLAVAADLDSLLIDAPLIVVEVASPTSDRDRTGRARTLPTTMTDSGAER